MGVEDKELQALAARVREHLETPEAKEAAQKACEVVPVTCSHARACMERHLSATQYVNTYDI